MAEALTNQRPIIIKKSVVHAHAGHHGGAWKVAYADFVTAMMAFFLLMWLLGATNEKQRKALADYFAPTIVEQKQASAGGDGLLHGESLLSEDEMAGRAGQKELNPISMRSAAGHAPDTSRKADAARFGRLQQVLKRKLAQDNSLSRFARTVRFTETKEGLRLDLVDDADYSMFLVGTDVLTPDARRLLPIVASALSELPNDIRVRGHTDASLFSRGARNNWTLSTARADATRQQLMMSGLPSGRFQRIEGVADREPYKPSNPYDPANRRISITLGWSSVPAGAPV